jgi:hypothetical protein
MPAGPHTFSIRILSPTRVPQLPPFSLSLFRVLVADAILSPDGSHQFRHVVAVSLAINPLLLFRIHSSVRYTSSGLSKVKNTVFRDVPRRLGTADSEARVVKASRPSHPASVRPVSVFPARIDKSPWSRPFGQGMSHQAWRTGFPSLASSLAFMFSLLVCLLYITTYALLLFALGRPGALHLNRRVGGKRMVICDVSSLVVSSSSGVVWLPALKDRHGSTLHEWASRGLTSSKAFSESKLDVRAGTTWTLGEARNSRSRVGTKAALGFTRKRDAIAETEEPRPDKTNRRQETWPRKDTRHTTSTGDDMMTAGSTTRPSLGQGLRMLLCLCMKSYVTASRYSESIHVQNQSVRVKRESWASCVALSW